MELALNLGWMVLTALMCGLWLRYGPREGADRRMQLVALALVILILFPVISVTDDILTAQNLAETDCCQRWDHLFASEHCAVHIMAAVILPLFTELSSDSIHSSAQGDLLVAKMETPALASVQNRPPPAL